MFVRKVILVGSIFSMVIGLILGLSRASFIEAMKAVSHYHFLIMSGSFFGTLITLERALTIKNQWAKFLPVINGISIVFFLINKSDIAILSLFLGGCAMFLMYAFFFSQHKNMIHLLFLISGWCYVMAVIQYSYFNNMTLSVRFFELFFLITIVAERMELARFINVSEYLKKLMFLFLLLALVISFQSDLDMLYGIIIILCSLWLINYDIAKKNIRSKEPHRFMGFALMVGYYWLLIHGLSILFPLFFTYDIQIHSFFLGFVMNMVFAHLTIILPAVLKIQYHINTKIYYPIWLFFQGILVWRFIVTMYVQEYFGIAALINVISVLLFFALNFYYLMRSR